MRSEAGNPENERKSVSDPWEKIEWGADSEPRINERVPSSAIWRVKLAHSFGGFAKQGKTYAVEQRKEIEK